MSIPFWYAVGELAVPNLTAQESAAAIMLAASLLVFRTFRERYLLTWILGWLAYLVSRWTIRGTGIDQAPSYLQSISQTEFILAICLFSAAVFIYTHSRKLILPLLLVTLTLMGYAVLRTLYWPQSLTLRVVLEVSYRTIALTVAIQVIRFRWGRWEIGPWLLGACFLLLHLDWPPVDMRLPAGTGLMVDLFFGLSMLLIVLDDSKMRTRRLGVVNALTTSIVRAQQYGPMMATALEELKGLMRAKAAWFRLLEGEKMVITQHIGISPEFLRAMGNMDIDETLSQVLQQGKPAVVKTSSASDAIRDHLKRERFHHVVVTPVLGKKSVIGTLSLCSTRRRSYTPDDMDFLSTAANQLGIAVENLRLLEQVLRSQRQWRNTFDSIQDIILAHDSDFRIIKANHSQLQRLGRSPSDVVGKLCETVLPRRQGDWTGCPYCAQGDVDFVEGADPCFGGYSMVSTSSYSEQGTNQKGTIHVVRDTTDRRVAEEKYRLLFEQVQEGLFVATPDGKLLDCNDAFVKMLGYATRTWNLSSVRPFAAK